MLPPFALLSLLTLLTLFPSPAQSVTPVYTLNIGINPTTFNTLNSVNINADPAIEYNCNITFNNIVYTNVTICLHGGYSRNLPKKNYELRFYNTVPRLNLWQYRGDTVSKVKTFLLGASAIDPTFMRQKLLSDNVRKIGGLAPRIVFGEVYVNFVYHGFYLFEERINDDFIQALDWNTDGNLYKATTHDGDFKVKVPATTGYSQTLGFPANNKDVADLLWAVAVTPKNYASWSNVTRRASVADWMLYNFVQYFGYNEDGFNKNYYMYHDPNSTAPFRFISWDMDSTWGNNWFGNKLTPPAGFYGWDYLSITTMSIPEYLQSYILNFQCLIKYGPLEANALISNLTTVYNEIKSFALRDYNKWTGVYATNFGGQKYDNRSPDTQIADMTSYITSRGPSLISQMTPYLTSQPDVLKDEWGLPLFTCGKLRVSTLTANYSVYISEVLRPNRIELFNNMDVAVNVSGWYLSKYFFNRTASQIPKNSLLPAKGYLAVTVNFVIQDIEETLYLHSNLGQPVDTFKVAPPLPENLSYGLWKISTGAFKKTFFQTTTFGAPNSYPYLGPLVMTEILWNPSTGAFEYIAFQSVVDTPTPLYLSNDVNSVWDIGGLSFSFPPQTTIGARQSCLVLVGNSSLLRLVPSVAYPARSDVVYFNSGGKLDNAGEQVSIQRVLPSKLLVTLDEVDYLPTAPWPVVTAGKSIRRKGIDLFGNDPANWEIGAQYLLLYQYQYQYLSPYQYQYQFQLPLLLPQPLLQPLPQPPLPQLLPQPLPQPHPEPLPQPLPVPLPLPPLLPALPALLDPQTLLTTLKTTPPHHHPRLNQCPYGPGYSLVWASSSLSSSDSSSSLYFASTKQARLSNASSPCLPTNERTYVFFYQLI